jgi:transcriptional regulator with XRE-family HTH domain
MSDRSHYIKEWRKFRKLTQDELAERVGITRTYLSKIENAKRKYDQRFLEAAADALECTIADLLVRDPSEPEGIWSVWEELEPFERAQAIEVLKALKRTSK